MRVEQSGDLALDSDGRPVGIDVFGGSGDTEVGLEFAHDEERRLGDVDVDFVEFLGESTGDVGTTGVEALSEAVGLLVDCSQLLAVEFRARVDPALEA